MNTSFGFYSTIAAAQETLGPLDPGQCYDVALKVIVGSFDAAHLPAGADLEAAVRAFLDSRYGRHFGDAVATYIFRGCAFEEALKLAITDWKTTVISRRWRREINHGGDGAGRSAEVFQQPRELRGVTMVPSTNADPRHTVRFVIVGMESYLRLLISGFRVAATQEVDGVMMARMVLRYEWAHQTVQ